MSNLSVNFLMDGYPNETSAEQALFSFLDRAPFRAVHISAGAKAEQGFSIAKKTRARYRDMLVFFRKLPNDVQHLHYPDVSAWFESLAPWSDGGKLILPITNEPGVVDLKRQNDWYAAAIERFGKAGIRTTAPAMQTHNRFPSSMLLDTWIALDKYNGFIDLHYYADPGDDTYSFPIDHIHKTIAAYCKPKGITTRFIISELGYLYRLGAYAGYHGGQGGGMDGAEYAALLIAEARANPDVLYHIFGMGNQAPWGECNIDGDDSVIKPIVAYNKETATMPTTPDIPAPTTGGVKAKLTTIPGDYINVRAQPNPASATSNASADVGDLLVGDVVTYYPDAKQGEWVYQTPLTPVQRPAGRQNAAAGWVSEQGGKVTFEKVVDLPPVEPPPVEPPAEETVEFKVSEVDAMIAANEQALAILRGAKLPGDGTKMLLNIPFVSQLGTDADSHNNDCLVADLLMFDRYLKTQKTGVEPDLPTVDMIVPVTALGANPKALMTFADGIALAKRLGFKVEYRAGMTPDEIKKSLNVGAPVIGLVDYARYNPAGTSIPHFMVITGYDGDSFITHDPYLLGQGKTISADKLDAAMKTSPGNSGEYQALVLAA